MYRYDHFDQRIVDERVAQFRDQTRRYLAGALTEDEFRPLRLQNGLYIQKHAPMLRVAIPYGQLSSRQLRTFAHIARRYDRGYGHFTTRQNFQFNWPHLEQVPDILALLARVEMHAIQTSGNCIRNVTSDHFAGVAGDETVDPRPYAELIRQWSTLHPEFAYLPRKFKIAVTGATRDRAAILVHDIGLQLVLDDAGNVGFRVAVGGGLGRTPIVGHVIREFLPRAEILNYLDAILRVYNRFGRRDNKYKARIKILVKERTPAVFARDVEAEWAHLRGGPATVPDDEFARLAASFVPPAYEPLPADDAAYRAAVVDNRPFANWVGRNVHPHKVPGYAIVTLSLKKTGVPPGDVTSDQMDAIANLADRYSFGELRVSHEQNLVFTDVKQGELLCAVARTEGAGTRDAERRPADEHRLLPGRGLLLARQREVDPDRRGHPAPVRRPGRPARHRGTRPQHLGLHERVRPPPRRPHRRAGRRQERLRVVPGDDRRHAGRARGDRPRHRPVVRRRRDARRRRAARRDLRRPPPRRRAFRRHRSPRRHRTLQGARLCNG